MERYKNMIVLKNKINCNSKIKVPKLIDDISIYHYTSTDGMKNIIGNSSLWFSNVFYMNDANEVNDGIKSLIQYVFSKWDDLDEELSDMKTLIETQIKDATQLMLNKHIFVCCFSKGQDELPMWNYYTKDNLNQGYNISYDYRKLLQSIIFQNAEGLDKCEISFGQVIYTTGKKNKYMLGLQDCFMNEYSDIMKNLFETLFPFLLQNYKNDTDKTDDELKELYMVEVNEMIDSLKHKKKILPPICQYDGSSLEFHKGVMADPCLFYKDGSFATERELRIVITVPDEKLVELKNKGIYKFRNSHGVLTPYLDLKYNQSAINGITIAPTVKDDLAERSIKEYLQYCGLKDDSLRITKSKIPVRF